MTRSSSPPAAPGIHHRSITSSRPTNSSTRRRGRPRRQPPARPMRSAGSLPLVAERSCRAWTRTRRMGGRLVTVCGLVGRVVGRADRDVDLTKAPATSSPWSPNSGNARQLRRRRHLCGLWRWRRHRHRTCGSHQPRRRRDPPSRDGRQ
jgi:hypothetical protein